MASSKQTRRVKSIAIIPARLASTRLPRKVLREINGRPMLAHVYEAARACPALDDVIVATDSDEVADLCRANGWHFRMTSPLIAAAPIAYTRSRSRSPPTCTSMFRATNRWHAASTSGHSARTDGATSMCRWER